MASPTSPTHGVHIALYRLRPGGFVGQGLNDASWNLVGFSGLNSTYLEVEIMTAGTPDKYRFRQDGGAWDDNAAAGYSITGGAQTIADGITITFVATTGHTVGDKWSAGFLKDEACTESGDEAQITAAANRRLNPNNPPTFTDDGGETVLQVRHTNGWAKFTGNVGNVTVDGEYIPAVALEAVGFLRSWDLSVSLDMADASRAGAKWKEWLPGQAGFNGSAEAFFIGCDTFWDSFEDTVEGVQDYFLLQLFLYDPDQDQTGDHFNCWAVLTGFNPAAPINDLVKETVNFSGQGAPAFVADS